MVSDVEPGWLNQIVPTSIPEKGEPWEDIQKDITEKIIPGITHWYVEPINNTTSRDVLIGSL